MPPTRTLSPLAVLAALVPMTTLACGDPANGTDPATNADSTDGTGATTVEAPAGTATDDGPTDSSGGTAEPPLDSDGSTSGESSDIEPGPDTTVVAFEGSHVFFSGWDEGDNLREIDVEIEFPAAELAYTSATLNLALSCPDGACDWWDRKGSLGIVDNAGTEQERVLEIARFVTPYRVEGSWQLDVTALRPLLSGSQTLRVFIDTWVGPGHANGNGWIVDARFDFVGGVPAQRPVAVLPLWGLTEVEVGDPGKPLADQLPEATITVPANAARVELWSVLTGHGQGNLDNCAEFCPLIHGYNFGGSAVQRTVWRDDCGDNPVSNQQGTWTLSRAGWCPGDIATPWVEDLTGQIEPDTEVAVQYDVQGYENSCRPDAPVCMGCALGTGCEYDGANHTAPTMLISAAVVVYEDTGR